MDDYCLIYEEIENTTVFYEYGTDGPTGVTFLSDGNGFCSSDREEVLGQPNTALLSTILTLGTFLLAYFLKMFRDSRFLGRGVRYVIIIRYVISTVITRWLFLSYFLFFGGFFLPHCITCVELLSQYPLNTASEKKICLDFLNQLFFIV